MNQSTDTKNIYGLIGYPLSHSFSQKYFREKFKNENIIDSDYLNFPLQDISEINELITNNPGIKGFNVTIPYKEQIIQYLTNIDKVAEKIGAVNTVKCHTIDGKKILTGYNTDIYGFELSLKPLLTGKEKNALILGYGGAAKTVHFVLKQLGVDIKIASRNKKAEASIITKSTTSMKIMDDKSGNKQTTKLFPDENIFINYNQISKQLLGKTDLIINTTPLGMWPKIDEYPDIPYEAIKNGSIAFDLIYNPETTLFLKKCKEYGATVKNGYEMLVLQAEKAWEIFNIE